MGRVYQARDLDADRPVAVKLVSPEHKQDSEIVARFEREKSATMRVDHPNVVRVHGHGTTPDGALYLVLEYLEGRSLDRVILTDSPMPFERVARITRQIATALVAAHAQRIVHRDLKPENVMLVERYGETDIVKILDFGLAQLVDEMGDAAELTMQGSRVGTPHYMAPEYVSGFVYDARSDLYALGVLAFEMCTGRTPFLGTPNQVFTQQVEGSAPPLKQLRPDAPDEIASVVDRLLRREPDSRPQRATEVAVALSRLAAVRLPSLPPDAATEDRLRRAANAIDFDGIVSPASRLETPTLPAGRSVAAKVRRGTTDTPRGRPEPARAPTPQAALTTVETLRDADNVRDTLKMKPPAPRRPRVEPVEFPPAWVDRQLVGSACLGLLTLALATILFLTTLIFFLSTR